MLRRNRPRGIPVAVSNGVSEEEEEEEQGGGRHSIDCGRGVKQCSSALERERERESAVRVAVGLLMLMACSVWLDRPARRAAVSVDVRMRSPSSR